MGENTAIEWADHTFNPWSGCTKVSPACTNCYAETMCDRFPHLGGWGPGKPRKRTGKANWAKPLAWNRKADPANNPPHELVVHPRVFCASLADWLDPEVPVEWLADLLVLIAETPHLDWLLLTKRPELWRQRLQAVISHYPPATVARKQAKDYAFNWAVRKVAPANVWLGVTVEDKKRADERRPHLLAIPAAVRFVSYEPALGEVDWLRFFSRVDVNGEPSGPECNPDGSPAVGWLICGGESGGGARPMHPEWARSARDACQEAGVAFLFKQWGAWRPRYSPCAENGISDTPTGKVFKMWPDGSDATRLENEQHGDCYFMERVGKKSAGRLLDGRTWDGTPSPRGESR